MSFYLRLVLRTGTPAILVVVLTLLARFLNNKKGVKRGETYDDEKQATGGGARLGSFIADTCMLLAFFIMFLVCECAWPCLDP